MITAPAGGRAPEASGARIQVRNGRRTAQALLYVFMFTTVLVPATLLNKLLFVALMGWTLLVLLGSRPPRLVFPVFCVMGIFLYGLMLGASGGANVGLAVQFFLSTFVLMLIHFIEHFRIDMDAAGETCGRVMLVVTAGYWLLVLSPGLPYSAELVMAFNEASLSATASREFLTDGTTFTLALGAAPFLFVPWCVVMIRLLRERRPADVAWVVLYGIVIVMSGSRGLMVVALAYLLVAIFVYAGHVARIVSMVAAAGILVVLVPLVVEQTNLFSSDEVSNAGKIGHFLSYIDSLDGFSAVFGNGLGSYYYSSGVGLLTAHTELTPVDMARYVGIPLALLFFISLTLPSARIDAYLRDRGLRFIAFLLYLVLSITNPVLVNSYGMLVVLWYWAGLRQAPPLPRAAHNRG